MRPRTDPDRFPTRLCGAVALLALLGAAASAVLLHHHAHPQQAWLWLQAFCGGTAGSGCDLVNRSAASRLLGLPLALWGFHFYGALCVLALTAAWHRQKVVLGWLFALALLGLLVDVGLLSYSIFSLGTVCNLCAVTYAATLGILALALQALRRQPAPRLRGTRPGWAGLLAFGALAVLASGGYLHERIGTGPQARAPYQDPDEALYVAWSVFLESYLATAPVPIDVEQAPTRGTANPALRLVLFADFLCSHCRRAATLLDRFAARHRDSVQLAFKHYPLDDACNAASEPVHAGSCRLAQASVCAAYQGGFWPFLDQLFAQQELWRRGVSDAQLVSLAGRSGLEPERFALDLGSTAARTTVAADIAEANAIGVTGTPALFINGRRMHSIPIMTFLEELLRDEVERNQPFVSRNESTTRPAY